MNPIDALLNRITMYRLVVYSLGLYVAAATSFAFMGKLSITPTELAVSGGLLIGSAYISDRVLAWLFRVPTNSESALITALIMLLIIQPAHSLESGLILGFAGGVSSLSKFLLSWHNKHIFNPAAFAAAVVSLAGLQATTWWIGNSVFWPFTLILGLAIVRKIRRTSLFISFAVVSILLQFAIYALGHEPIALTMKQALIASPLIFLGTIMLTEPATMPSRRTHQVVFASLVGVLYITAWTIGSLTIYPEVALLLANIYAFVVSPKFHVRLQLAEIQKISDRVYNYIFKPESRFAFLPGQYMQWTLASVPYDSRGNRRTFTIASSPTEDTVQLGVKYYEPASTYKANLIDMEPGDIVYASQLAGNFTLRGKESKKLAFIAGGIGITPFRSMIKYLTDTNQQVDLTLLYIVSDPSEFAYAHDLQAAGKVGVKIMPIVTNLSYQAKGVVTAKLDAELIRKLVPDYSKRLFYISGPNVMVYGAKQYLRTLGVKRRFIKTDHFSGY